MLIIAYLSKELVIFHHLWVEHIFPPVPHSDPVVLSTAVSFLRSSPAHLPDWHGSVPALLFFVFVFF